MTDKFKKGDLVASTVNLRYIYTVLEVNDEGQITKVKVAFKAPPHDEYYSKVPKDVYELEPGKILFKPYYPMDYGRE